MPKDEELKAFRKQNLIPAYNDSSSEKTMLHREARALAISRLEESARTEEEFANWAFTFTTSFLYYMDYDSLDEQTKKLYRQGMSAFGGISPTYHISLAENAPVIVWNFHSLLVMIQMCFSFMLTDSDCDMKLCKHCGRAFIASRKGNEFCSPKCKNQYNVYKTRARKKRNNSHIPTKTANYQQLVDDLPSLIFYYFVNDIYAIAGSFFTIFSISDMLFSVTSAICSNF